MKETDNKDVIQGSQSKFISYVFLVNMGYTSDEKMLDVPEKKGILWVWSTYT